MNNAARTALAVHLARAAGFSTPRRRMPLQQYPHLVEVEYGKVLLAQVGTVHHAVLGVMHTLVNGAIESASNTIDDLRRQFAAGVSGTTGRLGVFAVRVFDHQAAQLDRQTRAVLGVPVALLGITMRTQAPATVRVDAKRPATVSEADRITAWVHENVALIKDLGDKPLREIERLVTRAHAAGNRHETLARDIAAKLGEAEDRARRIARDQIGKLNGRISADRHQRMGLTRFRWRTCRDPKVRPTHRELEGKEFFYTRPPLIGLPGQPICCRCHDEPIFDDILAELDRLEAAPAIGPAPTLPRAKRARGR